MTNTILPIQGKTLLRIEGLSKNSDSVTFYCDDGTKYLMTHNQDCCETVEIVDFEGEISDLLNTPLVIAEEVNYDQDPAVPEDRNDGSHTWTFYRLATVKGYLDLRWLGTSNGYYSEDVCFEQI